MESLEMLMNFDRMKDVARNIVMMGYGLGVFV